MCFTNLWRKMWSLPNGGCRACTWRSLALVLCLLGFSCGQFPRVCVNDSDLRAQRCCPDVHVSGANMPCGGPGRGSCVAINDSHCHVESDSGPADVLAYLKNKTLEPSRYPWPTRVFTQICECQGNWAGYDCDECKLGYERKEASNGTICSQLTTPFVRRNYLSLPAAEQSHVKQVIADSRDRVKGRSRFAALMDESHFSSSAGTVSALTAADFETELSTYEFLVWLHYFAAKDSGRAPRDQPEYEVQVDFAHESSTFLVWHRYYMLLFESELRNLSGSPAFTLPYWDWLDQDNRGEFFSNSTLYDGDNTGVGGVFQNFSVTCHDASFALDSNGVLETSDSLNRTPNRGKGSLCNSTQFQAVSHEVERNYGPFNNQTQFLPSLRDVWDIYSNITHYDAFPFNATFDPQSTSGFRNSLEGFTPLPGKQYCAGSNTVHEVHNAVHIYVGGTMANVAASPCDPIFWMHHCMVDRVFEKFIVKLANAGTLTYIPVRGAAPGHNADDCMVPFFPLHRNKDYLKISTDFGYEYDNLPDLDTEPTRPAGQDNQCKLSPATVSFRPATSNKPSTEQSTGSDGSRVSSNMLLTAGLALLASIAQAN